MEAHLLQTVGAEPDLVAHAEGGSPERAFAQRFPAHGFQIVLVGGRGEVRVD